MTLKFKSIQMIAPLCVGVVAFLMVVGPKVLDPTNIFWLFWKFDPSVHYLGWAFFREGPWTFPLGLNPNYGLDFSNSIVFSDSLPLFAIFFKLLRAILPEPFQYFGWWTLLCFLLQAWFGWKLLKLVSSNFWVCCFGTTLFVFAPPMLWRVAYHGALIAHFLILAALYLNFRSSQDKRQLWWALLLIVSSLVHFYILAIVCSLWIANLLDVFFCKKQFAFKDLAKEFSYTLLLLTFCLWQAGYFAISLNSGAGSGYGAFKLNLLSPFYARDWSYVWRYQPPFYQEYDSVNFFGVGIFLIFPFAIYGLLRCQGKILKAAKHYRFLICILILLTMYAITNQISIGEFALSFPLPDLVLRFANTFRSSGRMFWPAFYCILLLVIYGVVNGYGNKTRILILCVATFIQIIDTSAGWLVLRQQTMVQEPKAISSQNKSPLASAFWENAASHYRNIVIAPPPNPTALSMHLTDMHENWWLFALFAAKHHMGSNSVAMSRVDNEALAKSILQFDKKMKSGNWDPMTLYILDDWRLHPNLSPIQFNPSTDLLARIDDFNVLAPGWKNCASCKPFSNFTELETLTPLTYLNQVISFGNSSGSRKNYLLEGWAFSEGWGTWSNGRLAKLVLPLPKNTQPDTLVFNLRAFVTPKIPQQIFNVFIDGKLIEKIVLNKPSNNVVAIKVPESAISKGFIALEFQFINPAQPKVLFDNNSDDRELAIGLESAVFK
jgi:hypothetical protein